MSKRHQYCSRKYDYSTLIESVLRSSYASSEQIFCFMCFVVQSCRLRLENGDIDRYPRSVEGGSSFVTSLTSRVLRRGGYEGFTEILDQAGIALLSAQIVENYCIQLLISQVTLLVFGSFFITEFLMDKKMVCVGYQMILLRCSMSGDS